MIDVAAWKSKGVARSSMMSSHKDAFWRANNPCWICRVSAGTAKASIVAQNEALLVLISPMPLNPGHALVVTRRHVRDLYELPDELAGPILSMAARIARAAKRAFFADGITLRQHNEPAGGQEVFHFHLHVIPRFVGDDSRFNAVPQLITRERQESLAAQLRATLAAV
jgi:histidine triad (HIT) family protein